MKWSGVGSTRKRAVRMVALLCLVAACSPVRGCVESDFELAPESRLPNWVQLAAGVRREDVSLDLYYYAPPFRAVDDTVFVLRVKGQPNRTSSGRQWWHPRTKRQLDAFYATEPRPEFPHPSYVVVEVNGQIDVIEHRGYREQNRDPSRALFWMTGDPTILREALESRAQADALRLR